MPRAERKSWTRTEAPHSRAVRRRSAPWRLPEQAMQEPARLAFLDGAYALPEDPVVHRVFGLRYKIVSRHRMPILPADLDPFARRDHAQRRAVERTVAAHDELHRLVQKPGGSRKIGRRQRGPGGLADGKPACGDFRAVGGKPSRLEH